MKKENNWNGFSKPISVNESKYISQEIAIYAIFLNAL